MKYRVEVNPGTFVTIRAANSASAVSAAKWFLERFFDRDFVRVRLDRWVAESYDVEEVEIAGVDMLR
jgi:hypothetical protein